jgi:hypothetical protein
MSKAASKVMTKSLTLLRPSFFPGHCLRGMINPSRELRSTATSEPSPKSKGVLAGVDRWVIVQKAFGHELVRRICAAFFSRDLPGGRAEDSGLDAQEFQRTMCWETLWILQECTSLPNPISRHLSVQVLGTARLRTYPLGAPGGPDLFDMMRRSVRTRTHR